MHSMIFIQGLFNVGNACRGLASHLGKDRTTAWWKIVSIGPFLREMSPALCPSVAHVNWQRFENITQDFILHFLAYPSCSLEGH